MTSPDVPLPARFPAARWTRRPAHPWPLIVVLALLPWASAAADDVAPPKLPTATPEATGMDAARLGEIEPLVSQAIDDGEMAGAVVLIGHRGRVVYHRAFGHRQLEPRPLPMAKDTLFDLASLTKPVATATSIMILAQQGQIDLDDPVAKHLPAFDNHGKEQVTIRQLLLHTGGLVPDNSLRDYERGTTRAIDRLMQIELNYPPGTRFRYSDVGFLVLAELVRHKTGQPIDRFSRAHIFAPLGMTETGYLPEPPLRARAAVTEQRDGRWMVGEVHDPRAYALGGVAGHAGLFSTASDLAVYAQMMIGQGQYAGVRILSSRSVRRMTDAYPVPQGQRGLGWDKRSAYSSNRGETMSDAAFGHGGFTGTAMWIDPQLQLFVIFLSNRLHPDGRGSVNGLAGRIGTIAADAARASGTAPGTTNDATDDAASGTTDDATDDAADDAAGEVAAVLCGIDVLQRDGFAPLRGRRVGLITNHTGVNRRGEPTVRLLHAAPDVHLQALFSPEHGIAGNLDQARIANTTDAETGLPIFSLYGQDRKPTERSLQGIDTLVFDIQDIGTRFYTYVSTMGGAMEVAAQHGIRFVVLDRPNPINGVDVAGPMRDDDQQSFVAYHTLPVRHGMTVGELARMLQAERFPALDLQVVRCEGWRRDSYYDATGLYWINPSPNMRNLNQAILYPGVGLLEYTNLSVGRGTDTPFEIIGAPWIDGRRLAHQLNRLSLPGVGFIPHRFTPDSSKFADQSCEGVQILITHRAKIDPLAVGFAIALALHRGYPDDWEWQKCARLLASADSLQAIDQLQSLDDVLATAGDGVDAFLRRRQPFLLYDDPTGATVRDPAVGD